ncbi:MAG: hypothetical protein J2P18_18305 [Nocardia sp.]|nr:hypothetical protein [Nocardia sp.]
MLFDIRTIVGALLGVYGIVLIVTAAVHDTAAERARAGGWNINLWAGIGMLVVGALFLLWAVLRPVRRGPVADAAPAENAGTPEAGQ